MLSFQELLTNFKYLTHNNKPKLLARTAYNYSLYLMGKRPRIRYIDCILYYDCNLKCAHCSCETLKDKSRKQLTPKDWGNVARQAEKLGAIIFGIQGGEPLVYPQLLEEVIKEIDSSRNFISVKTNGTIASEELFGKLKKWKVDSVTVGFGPVPNEFEFDDYDRITRHLKDSYNIALKTVELLAKAGIKPMMSVVISRKNIRSKVFQGMIDIAKSYNSILTCALAVPVGSWESNYDLMLRPEDRKELEAIMKQHPHVRTDFSTNWSIKGCGALKEKLYISPYGDVLPCPFVHISFGNVLNESLDVIWKRGISTKAFGEYPSVCLAAEDKKFLSYLEVAKRNGKLLPISSNDSEIKKILSTTEAERARCDD